MEYYCHDIYIYINIYMGPHMCFSNRLRILTLLYHIPTTNPHHSSQKKKKKQQIPSFSSFPLLFFLFSCLIWIFITQLATTSKLLHDISRSPSSLISLLANPHPPSQTILFQRYQTAKRPPLFFFLFLLTENFDGKIKF